jgi:hypothetical protein
MVRLSLGQEGTKLLEEGLDKMGGVRAGGAYPFYSESLEDSPDDGVSGPALHAETPLIDGSSKSWTLAIWPYDLSHKVGILQRSLGLFAARYPTATRKKPLDTWGSCSQARFKRGWVKVAKSPITMVARG